MDLSEFSVFVQVSERMNYERIRRPKNDDYNAIMVKALADRFAEAFAEYLQKS